MSDQSAAAGSFSVTPADIERMRGQLFFEGPDRSRRFSRYWLLLVLAAIIASAGVASDSTATVIGAMIVAPLMTPILGIVLAIVLTDVANLRRSVLLVLAGALLVVAVGWLVGLLASYPIVAATNTQVAARVTPRLVDLVAALATGAVGSIALARSDISDTLPGVAIAISLVPPLAVVGITLSSGAPSQSLGALLLFGTNVAAILASGTVVMALYHVSNISDLATGPAFRRSRAHATVALLLAVVIVPLWLNSASVSRTRSREAAVQAVAENWAGTYGWQVLGVTTGRHAILVSATGPPPEPSLNSLRRQLEANGLADFEVRAALVPDRYTQVTR